MKGCSYATKRKIKSFASFESLVKFQDKLIFDKGVREFNTLREGKKYSLVWFECEK